MRHSCLLAMLFLTSLLQPISASSIDSLRTALSHVQTPSEQIRLYRGLADATADTPEACGYLIQLIQRTKAAKQTHNMMEALTDLTLLYLQLDKPDSAHYYAAAAEKYVPGDQRDQWCSFLRMRIFNNDLQGLSAERAVDEKIEEFRTRDIASESIYQQIEAEFCVAMALESKGQREDVIAHLQKALELSEKKPFRESAQYQILILRQLARIHNSARQPQAASEFTKRGIEVREKYYARYEKQARPYLSLDGFYIANYASLLVNIQNMPDTETNYYLDRLVEMSDRSNNPSHKYNRFHAQFNYHVTKNNIPQALAYNDSLIYYARKIAVYNLPGLYKINSIIFETTGRNKEALDNLRVSHGLKDSIRRSEMHSQIDEMRVEYDVNRLNYEKSQLQIRNKHILLVTLSIALLVVGVLCIQLYRHLNRERKRKKHMQQLKLQAEESEKLKTTFINSVCHEIRTPLDNIVVSADRLLDPAFSEEARQTCPDEIMHNATLLLSLIDSMLEVSSLNVSDEKLPRKLIDVAELCRKAFGHHSQNHKSGVVSLAQLPNQPLVIPTSDRYLPLVIENLLSNAYKFTRRGSVTLCCERREMSVVISVTDTGCGIPVDKQQQVFERFVKLDPDTPGSGLGLYLCKLIIGKLSGSISIDSGYTKGTCITVTLPVA